MNSRPTKTPSTAVDSDETETRSRRPTGGDFQGSRNPEAHDYEGAIEEALRRQREAAAQGVELDLDGRLLGFPA